MAELSLDSLTLPKASPQDIIRSASTAGFDLVSLAVQPPYVYPQPLVVQGVLDDCLALMSDTGVQVQSLEFFVLADESTTETYRSALELGSRLGGKNAVVLNLMNENADQAAEQLAYFSKVAADYGLGVNFEPVAGSQTPTLESARDLVKASGADVGLLFDALHLMRSGGGVEDIEKIEPGLIRYIQLCDGPATLAGDQRVSEAIEERLYPGDGEFPLEEILRACPRNVPIAIEAPSLRRFNEGVSASDQASEAMRSLVRLLGRVGMI